MSDNNTIKVNFNDLSPELQDEEIEEFQNNSYFPEGDWYDWLWEDFVEEAEKGGVDIDADSLEFDLDYRAYIKYKGTMDFNNKVFSDLKSKTFDEFESKEWIYDVDPGFENCNELYADYNIESDIIYDDLESEIFNNSVEIDGDEAVITVDTITHINKGIKKYKEDIEDESFITELAGSLDAASLFFQDEIRVSEEDYETFLDDLRQTKYIQAESLVEEFFEKCELILTEYKDKILKDLKDTYEQFWTEENARENLENFEFTVLVDKDGNQLEIIDKN